MNDITVAHFTMLRTWHITKLRCGHRRVHHTSSAVSRMSLCQHCSHPRSSWFSAPRTLTSLARCAEDHHREPTDRPSQPHVSAGVLACRTGVLILQLSCWFCGATLSKRTIKKKYKNSVYFVSTCTCLTVNTNRVNIRLMVGCIWFSRRMTSIITLIYT